MHNNNDIPIYWDDDGSKVESLYEHIYLIFVLPEKVKVMEVWEAKEKIISFVFGSMETFI